MEKAVLERFEEIISGITCPRNCSCYTSGLKDICPAVDIGLYSYVACLKDHPSDCEFSVQFGDLVFCRCQARVYIAKNLRK